MAALWVGFFRFHGLLVDPARPAVVVRRGLIWDADRSALDRGALPGRGESEARTLCPELPRRPFDPADAAPRLSRAWDLLAEASSVVEPAGEGRPEAYAAWPSGSPPLAELRALAGSVRRDLPHVRLAAGLAANPVVALLACPPVRGVARVDPGGEAGFLSGVPLEALVARGLLAPAQLRRLAELDLHRCGQVAALPESALAARFGREGRRLHRICLGRADRPVRASYPPRALVARQAFPDGLPADARRRSGCAADLARRAAAGLRPGEGALRLRLRAEGGESSRGWRSPRREPDVLARAAAALAPRIPAATSYLEVRLDELAALPVEPLDLFARRSPERPLEALLDRLPRGSLRRGCGRPDPHDALLELLDPWPVRR